MLFIAPHALVVASFDRLGTTYVSIVATIVVDFPRARRAVRRSRLDSTTSSSEVDEK